MADYIDKAEMLEEVRKSRRRHAENPQLPPAACVTDRLARMLVRLVDGFAEQPEWRGYGYLSDMKGHAVCELVRAALKFDPERSDNPFGYFTRCTHNAFIRFQRKERKQADIRDALAEHHRVAARGRAVGGAWGWW